MIKVIRLSTCILLFQIGNLDSDTNQLASILGATRSNLDMINSSLVNTTLEVRRSGNDTKLSRFTYGGLKLKSLNGKLSVPISIHMRWLADAQRESGARIPSRLKVDAISKGC